MAVTISMFILTMQQRVEIAEISPGLYCRIQLEG